MKDQEISCEMDGAALRALLLDVREKLVFLLPNMFVPIVDNNGIHVLMLGRRESKAVQREIFMSGSGAVKIEVHGQVYPSHNIVPKGRQLPLTPNNVGYFVDKIVEIVNKVRILEICTGMNKEEYKEAWSSTPNGYVVSDTFKECRYKETFRSRNCSMLVEAKTWRCRECCKLLPLLKRRLNSMRSESPHPFTNNRYLDDSQKEAKLQEQGRTIKNQSRAIDRFEERYEEIMKKEQVKVDRNLSNDLLEILQASDLTENQSRFLQLQFVAMQAEGSSVKWHSIMIRLALSSYLRSPSPYDAWQKSGFIKLPTSRTLYDYTHAHKLQQGVDHTIIESVAKRVAFAAESKKHKQYHVLMADEIHVSKNLVIEKSTGQVIGFKDLDKIDQEVATLDSLLDNPDKQLEPEIATKILSFMVKACSSKVKDVVASFPVCNPSPKQMYSWTWEVIGALEKSGVKIIAFVCDGAPSNRAFFKLHKPVTKLPSGVIFDTINKYDPEKVLYFFSDIPHLLKTIRNAFFNSRLGKKGVRCLRKNGEAIVWDIIIRLFLSKKDKILRKSYKLNAQNVFPDSYTKMKVAPAAQVLSKTVGMDVLSQGWPKTSETVDFILKTNDWFDLLNGACTTDGKRKNNPKLNPYTMKDVEEFE